MVKVVEEELAIDGATGDNSTSPRGPRKMGLDEEAATPAAAGVEEMEELEELEAFATGGVGTMRGGVNP